MTQGWLSIALLVVLLAMLPMGLKWLQRRMGGASLTSTATTKIVSAIAVGPHQRVVTVETGPQEARVWLTLGVTAQQISCLHTAVAPAKFHEDHAPVASPLPVVES
ncbi:MAG: flagellar biosynthetic protein FliO [Rhodoferax sp.]|jgi:flagellar protein FliO/FliZ|nr:flagellar biosynthetic protein FliO [Rhodoferax sp.]